MGPYVACAKYFLGICHKGDLIHIWAYSLQRLIETPWNHYKMQEVSFPSNVGIPYTSHAQHQYAVSYNQRLKLSMTTVGPKVLSMSLELKPSLYWITVILLLCCKLVLIFINWSWRCHMKLQEENRNYSCYKLFLAASTPCNSLLKEQLFILVKSSW